MPTFEGPKADRIRGYMFESGEGVWLSPRISEQGAFICPRLWEEWDQFTDISDREFDHAKRILKLEVPDYARF
jgi:hypothetical protein